MGVARLLHYLTPIKCVYIHVPYNNYCNAESAAHVALQKFLMFHVSHSNYVKLDHTHSMYLYYASDVRRECIFKYDVACFHGANIHLATRPTSDELRYTIVVKVKTMQTHWLMLGLRRKGRGWSIVVTCKGNPLRVAHLNPPIPLHPSVDANNAVSQSIAKSVTAERRERHYRVGFT